MTEEAKGGGREGRVNKRWRKTRGRGMGKSGKQPLERSDSSSECQGSIPSSILFAV